MPKPKAHNQGPQQSEGNRRQSLAGFRGVKSKISIWENAINGSNSDQPIESKEEKTWRGKSEPGKGADAPTEEHGRAPRPITPILPGLRIPDLSLDASPRTTPRRMGESSPRLTPRQSIQRFLGGLIPGKNGKQLEGERSATPEGSSWPTLSPEDEVNASTAPMAAGTPRLGSPGRPATSEDSCLSELPNVETCEASGVSAPEVGLSPHGPDLGTTSMQPDQGPSPIGVHMLTQPSAGSAEPQTSPGQGVNLARVSPIVANLAAEALAIRAKQKALGGSSPSPTTRAGRRAFSPVGAGQSPLGMAGTSRGEARWTPSQAARMQENLNTNCQRLQGLDSPTVVHRTPEHAQQVVSLGGHDDPDDSEGEDTYQPLPSDSPSSKAKNRASWTPTSPERMSIASHPVDLSLASLGFTPRDIECATTNVGTAESSGALGPETEFQQDSGSATAFEYPMPSSSGGKEVAEVASQFACVEAGEPLGEMLTRGDVHLRPEVIADGVSAPCSRSEAVPHQTSPAVPEDAQAQTVILQDPLAKLSIADPSLDLSDGGGLDKSTPAQLELEALPQISLEAAAQEVVAPVMTSAAESSCTLSTEQSPSYSAVGDSVSEEVADVPVNVPATPKPFSDHDIAVPEPAVDVREDLTLLSTPMAIPSLLSHDEKMSSPLQDMSPQEPLSMSPVGDPDTVCAIVGDPVPTGFKGLTIKTRPAPGNVASPALESPESNGKRRQESPGVAAIPLRMGSKKRSPPGRNHVVHARTPVQRPVMRFETIDVPLLPVSPLTPVRTSSMSPRGSIFGMAGPGSPDLNDPTLLSAVEELIDSAYKTGLGEFDEPPSAVALQQAAVAAASPVPFPNPDSPLEGTEHALAPSAPGSSSLIVNQDLNTTPHTKSQGTPAAPLGVFPSPMGPLLYTTPEPKPQIWSTPQVERSSTLQEPPLPSQSLSPITHNVFQPRTLSPVQAEASSPPATQVASVVTHPLDEDGFNGQGGSSAASSDGWATIQSELQADTQQVNNTPGPLNQVSGACDEDRVPADPNSECAQAVVHAVVRAALGITSWSSSMESSIGIEDAALDQHTPDSHDGRHQDQVARDGMQCSDEQMERGQASLKDKGGDVGVVSPKMQPFLHAAATPDKANPETTSTSVVSPTGQGKTSSPAPLGALQSPPQPVVSPHPVTREMSPQLLESSGEATAEQAVGKILCSVAHISPTRMAASQSQAIAEAGSPVSGSSLKEEASGAADDVASAQTWPMDARSPTHANDAALNNVIEEASPELAGPTQDQSAASDFLAHAVRANLVESQVQVPAPSADVQPETEHLALASPTQTFAVQAAVSDPQAIISSPKDNLTEDTSASTPALPLSTSHPTHRIELPPSPIDGALFVDVSPASKSRQSNDENALPSPASSPGAARGCKSLPLRESVLSPTRVTAGHRGVQVLQTNFSSPTRSPLTSISVDSLQQLKSDQNANIPQSLGSVAVETSGQTGVSHRAVIPQSSTPVAMEVPGQIKGSPGAAICHPPASIAVGTPGQTKASQEEDVSQSPTPGAMHTPGEVKGSPSADICPSPAPIALETPGQTKMSQKADISQSPTPIVEETPGKMTGSPSADICQSPGSTAVETPGQTRLEGCEDVSAPPDTLAVHTSEAQEPMDEPAQAEAAPGIGSSHAGQTRVGSASPPSLNNGLAMPEEDTPAMPVQATAVQDPGLGSAGPEQRLGPSLAPQPLASLLLGKDVAHGATAPLGAHTAVNSSADTFTPSPKRGDTSASNQDAVFLRTDYFVGGLLGNTPRSSSSRSQGKARRAPALAASPGSATPSSWHRSVGGLAASPSGSGGSGLEDPGSPGFDPAFAMEASTIFASLDNESCTSESGGAQAAGTVMPFHARLGSRGLTRNSEAPGDVLAMDDGARGLDHVTAAHIDQVLQPQIAMLLGELQVYERDRQEHLQLYESFAQENKRLRDQLGEGRILGLEARVKELEKQLKQATDEKAAVESQFKILYREKYVPLKQSHAAILETEARLRTQRREAFEMVEKLRTQLATAELKVRKSNLDVATAEKTAQQMQKHVKKLTTEKEVDVATILRQEEQVSNLKHALQQSMGEAEQVRHELDDAKVKVKAAQQAREALVQEGFQKDERIVKLESKLQSIGTSAESARLKASYDQKIAELEEKLALSAADNAQLLAMCDQLVSDLESKGTL